MHESLLLTIGCDFEFQAPAPVTAVLQVAPHPDLAASVQREEWTSTLAHHGYRDLYDNRCERFTVPGGRSRITYRADVSLAAPADRIEPDTAETPPSELPDEVMTFLLPSRFCLPDELGKEAWDRFGTLTPGWGRVQAIVDFVHGHLTYLQGSSNPWTSAADAFRSRQGVCRDYAHLAITFCRALNIPARYVFGYVPDIGIPPPYAPMDFSAWFEVYLDGRWHTFDARINTPRSGRVIVGRGRDAVDVALITSLGHVALTHFQVHARAASEPAD